MSTFICILRGINVGGQKKILMADLRVLFESLGFKNTQTYIQSGNIVFKATDGKTKQDICETIETAIYKQFGFHVPALILTKAYLETVIKKNPFIQDESIDLTKLHLTFLGSEPESEIIHPLEDIDFSPDQFIIDGISIYVYCPNGYGRTKLSNNFFESKLKVTATTRNWKTVNTLLEMCDTPA